MRVSFRVRGDEDVAEAGWWIDDIRLYACADDVPGVPRITKNAAAITSATVSWAQPAYVGSGIASYEITRSDGNTASVSSAARSTTVTGFSATDPLTVSVAAVNSNGQVGPAARSTFYPSTTTISTSTTRARKGRYFAVTGKVVRRGTSTVVGGMPVTLQRRMWGKTAWANLSRGNDHVEGDKGVVGQALLEGGISGCLEGRPGVSLGSYSGTRTVSTP